MKTHFFLLAGEPSGDLHGSHLLKRLKEHMPHAFFTGVGGPLMRSEGLKISHLQMEDFAIMGFIDVLKNLPRLIRQFRKITHYILENLPDAVILIDYPDFNLRLAKKLRQQGYQGKIIQYVSPSIWAWRKKRIHTLTKHFDLLLTIYPFEQQYFHNSSLPVIFVGNPLGEYLNAYHYKNDWKQALGIPAAMPIIGLFPGSRRNELEKNLPLQLESVHLFLKNQSKPHAIAVSCSAPEYAKQILLKLKNTRNIYLIPREYTYELMKDSHIALAKSGTVTLELALHHCPTVVIYKLSLLNYTIAKYLMRIKLPFYCIVNLLMQKKTFPEFFDKAISPYKIAEELQAIYQQTPFRKACVEDCRHLSNLLNCGMTSHNAVEAILQSCKSEGVFHD